MIITIEISLSASQLDMVIKGLQSIKGYEVEDAAALLRLSDQMVKERDRLQARAQELPYFDPAVFKN